jgi:hypothetical protein
MMTINGNFTDADGNPVNIADLLRGVNQGTENQNRMSTISGWIYDSEGNPVNIIDIIRQADSTDVKGIKVNGGEPVKPNKDGYVEIIVSGDGQPVQLTTSEKNQLIGLLD